MTMAPLVVHGNVIVGPSGGEWVFAAGSLRWMRKTGRERWRAYNLGPDSDVKIGPRFQPFYQSERGHDLAATELAQPAVDARRRGRVGLAHVRSCAQPAVLRHQ